MSRRTDVELVYEGLSVFARRAREMSAEFHPGLTLVAYTQLSYIDARQDVRATDISADWGLDKSTVSRQLDGLVAAGLIERTGERPGRRGQVLQLTRAGRRALAAAETSIRRALVVHLKAWDDADVASFGALLARFNEIEVSAGR